MATWVNYWRIITPASKKQQYTQLATDTLSSSNPNAVTSISWYSHIMKGAGTRLQRYVQYDGMDNDVDVARALDIVAEEISNDDERTGLPFLIEYQNEDDEEVSETIVSTLRAACRHWTRTQDLNNRIFRTARTMIKYGDCFFRKLSDFKKWEFIDPSKVLGIEINEKNERIAYHLKKGEGTWTVGGRNDNVEIVPAAAIIHFSLSDDMEDTAPFGESILQPIFRTFKQLSMLEDSTIIYQIVRAPERRVFYVDVGNMPQQRVASYLESVKNQIRQKRQPNTTAGKENVDGTYNPNCLAMDTKVPLLDGRTLTITELSEEHRAGKINWAYSCNPETGEFAPGLITWAGKTRENAEVIKLTLDNGSEIICTPDHKFPIRGKGFVEAQYIESNDSLFPLNRQQRSIANKGNEYEQIWSNEKQQWLWTHRVVADWAERNDFDTKFVFDKQIAKNKKKTAVHHKNCNRRNNTPDNLVFMVNEDHIAWHTANPQNQRRKFSQDLHDRLVSIAEQNNWKKNETFRAAENDKLFVKLVEDVNEKEIDKIYKIKSNVLGDKFYKAFYPTFGYAGWKEFVKKNNPKFKVKSYTSDKTVFSQKMLSRLIDIVKESSSLRELMEKSSADRAFMAALKEANEDIKTRKKISFDKVSYKMINKGFEIVGASGFKEFKQNAANYNHKVVKIEKFGTMDVGTITIDGKEKYHNYHTFAIETTDNNYSHPKCLIYVKNSIQEDFFFPVTTSGRGTRVETLPGGENQGQNENLLYFQKKMFRGLRIPTSYMVGQDGQQAQYNDGKVGIAYIEELRFANFIKRLQNKLESVYDQQFKEYLSSANVIVNEELFLLKLPDPQNFALYRQTALDTELINAFKSVEDVEYLSRRFILSRYLGLTEDEIQMNEAMLKQERAIREDVNLSDLQQIYDKKVYESRPELKVEEPEEAAGGGEEEMGGEAPEEIGGMGGAPGEELPAGGPGGEENLTI
ncbi:MAG: portal protein [Candidatus Nitrosotenuis sp.]